MFFKDKDEIVNYIIGNQFARRNLTEEHKKFLRAKLYKEAKKEGFRGNQHTKSASSQNGDKQNKKTAEVIAEQFGVSKNTILRDEKYVDAIQTIVEATDQQVQDKILTKEIKATQKDIKDLASKEPKIIKEVIEEIKAPVSLMEFSIKPSEVKINQ